MQRKHDDSINDIELIVLLMPQRNLNVAVMIHPRVVSKKAHGDNDDDDSDEMLD